MSLKRACFSLAFCISMLSGCNKTTPEITVTENWVRATAQGQEVGAAYMTITSTTDTNLVGVESSIADSVEIHKMSMENGVMKMRMLEQLELKANTPNKLEPGGFHLMLFDLKKSLTVGEQTTFRLHFKNKAGKENFVTVDSPIFTDKP